MSHPAKAKSAKGSTALIKDYSLSSLFTFENLYEGFINARKGKRNKQVVHRFETELTINLDKLRNEIITGTYVPTPPRKFNINCNSSQKVREIAAPSFRDSVVQHTIYMLIYDIFDNGFIYDSYGCRKGKGNLRASNRCQEFMRRCDGDEYYLQIDIRKFYYSIRHDKLRESIERKIPSQPLVDIIMSFCDEPNGVGLNIGSLISQLFGLIILDRFDHYVKRNLKQKHYIRYVDDMVFIGMTFDEAKSLKTECERYLLDELGLTLSKWKIDKVRKGINFVGYRTWRKFRFIRKRSLYVFNRALKNKDVVVLQSILAHSVHTASYKFMVNKIIATLDVRTINTFLGEIRHELRFRAIQHQRAIRLKCDDGSAQ